VEDNRIDRGAVDVIGFHGQTVLHKPEMRLTVQIGAGPALAERLGVPVAYDFRAGRLSARLASSSPASDKPTQSPTIHASRHRTGNEIFILGVSFRRRGPFTSEAAI
jgi:hypothetical protein